jgi:hypothetical protein
MEGFTVFALREPYENYPSQILGRTVGASLAAGNACVVKPAEDACFSVVRIAELALWAKRRSIFREKHATIKEGWSLRRLG